MADPGLAGALRKPFAEQVAAFRLRLGNLVPTARWDDIRHAEHDRGFMVAGAAKADLLADLGAAVDKAVSGGATLEDFRRDFRAIVARHGWRGWTGEGTAKGEAWRTRVIFRTNMATSYAAGRHAQLKARGYKWWIYKHGHPLKPRLQHLAWDGLALPPDHPFWKKHYPPSGWGCTCRVRGAHTEAGIRRAGGDPDKPLPDNWNRIDPKTGAPVGIDKGWDYAPGASVAETVTALMDKLPALPAPIGAAMAAQWPAAARNEIARAFAGFVDEVLSRPPSGRTMVVGTLKPTWIAGARANGVEPKTAEIAVRDRDIWHTFRDSKRAQLDLTWYRALPMHLRAPRAVLLDTAVPERPTFLLVFDVGGGTGKLVVRLNYRVKKLGELNLIETGRRIEASDVRAMIGQGAVLIEGNV